MQSTASLTEDARQPPYLCLIALAKVLKATGATAKGQHEALLSFCEKRQGAHLFATHAAWLRVMLELMASPTGSDLIVGGFRWYPGKPADESAA